MVYKYYRIMIDYQKAKEYALTYVSNMGSKSRIELDILEEETIEFEYGWVFFYQSKAFIETDDEGEMIGGNAPFIIDRYNESLHLMGIRKLEDFYMQSYIKNRDNIAQFKRDVEKN